MKTITKYLFVFTVIILSFKVNGQPWMQPPYLQMKLVADSSKLLNFYDIQKAFQAYEKEHSPYQKEDNKDESENDGKFPGYMQYKRWEWYMEPRVYPTGDISQPSKTWEEFQKYLNSNNTVNKKSISGQVPLLQTFSGSWAPMGPFSNPIWIPYPWYYVTGMGRVNFISFDPSDNNIIWVGSPSGGIWKSINGGLTWNTNTDNLSVIGSSDLVIDPTNSNIMYIATGDANGSGAITGAPSIGVLKTIDGGITWNTTGLSWASGLYRTIYKLLINPINPNTIFAATTNGIYRTLNGGISWVSVKSGSYTDIEFKPNDTTVVYAVSGSFGGSNVFAKFYKSTNGGTSFANITSGLPPLANSNRYEIAVTPADPSIVYVLATSNNYGFYGLYRSSDSGNNFTLQSNSPNIIGSQGWYALAIEVNPSNPNDIIAGGLYMYRSSDAGVTWTTAGNTHADIHSLKFSPGTPTTIFSGNDGGVFKSTDNGVSFSDYSDNLQISQMYRLGMSASNPNLILTGHQDNGVNLLNSGIWAYCIDGDGMECIIDYTNDSIMYGAIQNGKISKTNDSWLSGSYTTIVNSGGAGVNADGSWITPFIMHPTNPSTLLVGKTQVYQSNDGGTNWSQVGTISGGTGSLIALAYAPSNPNYIYAAKKDKFYVSTDGNTFVDRTGTLLAYGATISYIAVSNIDPNKVWVTFSGYASGHKVYASIDAGVTWTNYSTGLPNLPANCIVYQNGTSNGLYVGTDVGVYFRSDSLSSWQPFFTGLPNVMVDELEIQYGAGKIRAATMGRGLWESDLAIPIPKFTVDYAISCLGQAINFTDQSNSGSTSWNWSFPNGTPSSSTVQNPSVTYNAVGIFNVTLTVANANGSGTKTISGYITVDTISVGGIVSVSPDTICSGNSAILTLSDNLGSIQWQSSTDNVTFTNISGASSSIYTSPALTSTTFYHAKVTNSSCPSINSTKDSVIVNPLPTAIIIPSGATSFCQGDSVTLIANSTNSYLWSNGMITQNISVSSSGSYSVTLTNVNGCSATSDSTTVTANSLPTAVIISSGAPTLCQGDSVILTSGFANSYLWSNYATTQSIAVTSTGNYSIMVTDVNGCSTTSLSTIVTVNPIPLTPTITQNGTTLTSSSTSGNQWYLNGNIISGATLQNDSVNQSGNYTVMVTDSNNCSATSLLYNFTTVSIQDLTVNNSIIIIPNPNKGIFHIETKKLQFSKIIIYNTLGEIIYESKNQNSEIDLSAQPKGIYFMELTTSEKIYNKKLLIE